MKYYPTRNDLNSEDKLERVVKDIYDKLPKPVRVQPSKAKPRRINTRTGKAIEE